MKILTINWTYGYGSTGKLICDIEKELPECEFLHCYEYDTIGGALNAYCLTGWLFARVHNRMSRLKGLQYQNGITPTIRLLRKIEEYKPDIVHIHCPNGNTLNLYKILEYLKANNILTVITNHAEFFYTGNCPYAFDCKQYLNGCRQCKDYKRATNSLIFNRAALSWKKMYAALHDFKTVQMVCVSPWQLQRLQESTICKGLPGRVIGNGIDTSVFHDLPEQSRLNTGRITLLQVTSSFSDDPADIKGGIHLIALAKRLSLEYEIRVAGACHLADSEKLPENITLLGNLNDQQQLAEEYRNADLVVLTSKKETFGMACAESLCCGTPVAGFLSGGTESIALPEYTAFCEYGDVDKLAQLVEKWGAYKRTMTPDERQKMTVAAAERYSKQTMAKSYLTLYEELLGKQKEEQ